MELNTKALIESLVVLKEDYGKTHTEITESSGVYNINRIITGTIEPTTKSWWKLHEAYPNIIPKPSFVEEGGKVFTAKTTGDGNKTSGGNMHITNNGNTLTSGQQYLIELLNKMNNKDEFVQTLISLTLQEVNREKTQK